jgi:hypothetical protein
LFANSKVPSVAIALSLVISAADCALLITSSAAFAKSARAVAAEASDLTVSKPQQLICPWFRPRRVWL